MNRRGSLRHVGFDEITRFDRQALVEMLGRLSPPAAFGEFCKIIFVKVRDEQALRKKGDFYDFQLKTHEPAGSLADRIRALYDAAKTKEPDVFTETLKVDDLTLRSVVSHIEGINFSKTDLDTKGVAFEQFLDGFFKGDFGQYFTPREIIQFAVEMMKPVADNFVLDPACGSGGFLLYAMDHVRHQAEELFADDPNAAYRHWHDFARSKIFGIEINDEIARVAKMNMILHDDGHTNITGADALDRLERLREANLRLRPATFDLVLTNPPFGAVVKESEKGSAYMEGWELLRYVTRGADGEGEDDPGRIDPRVGKKSIRARKSIKTEILFLERVWHFLKPGDGRAAVVLPDGILTNSSLQGVRDWLLERFQLLAVVSLPHHAFQHSGAGVKASVVFLRRRGEDETPDDNEAIFMAAPENIGYDATGRKTARGEVVREEDRVRVRLERSDLFDVEIREERQPGAATSEEEWQERSRRVLPETGVVGQYRLFERNPAPFFV